MHVLRERPSSPRTTNSRTIQVVAGLACTVQTLKRLHRKRLPNAARTMAQRHSRNSRCRGRKLASLRREQKRELASRRPKLEDVDEAVLQLAVEAEAAFCNEEYSQEKSLCIRSWRANRSRPSYDWRVTEKGYTHALRCSLRVYCMYL